MTALRLSARVRRVKLSPNAAANQRAADLRAAGRDIINLTIGEPDFDTPAHIVAAALAAAQAGDTRYPPTNGTPRLRQAIVDTLSHNDGLAYAPGEILVSNGAKHVATNALAATLDPGDEVIIPAPFWPSFPDMVLINDGVPVIVRTEAASGFKLSPAALAAAITPATRWLILNAPCNPSGADYSEAELAALVEVLRAHPQVLVLLDAVYEQIRFTVAPAPHLLQIAPDLRDRVLVVSGVSKTYAMTGWRIGYGAGPAELIRAMTNVQSQYTAGASTVGQAAALAALTGDQGFVATARAAYAERRKVVSEGLAAIPGIDVVVPEGTFFIYPGCGGLLGRVRPDGRAIETDSDFTEYLLEDAGVAAMPGATFGLSPFFRLSFATDTATVAAAVARIADAVAALRPAASQRPALTSATA